MTEAMAVEVDIFRSWPIIMKIFCTWFFIEVSSSLTVVGYDRRDGPYSRGGGGGYGNHARDNYGQFSC